MHVTHSTANAAMRYQHTAANRQQDLADPPSRRTVQGRQEGPGACRPESRVPASVTCGRVAKPVRWLLLL